MTPLPNQDTLESAARWKQEQLVARLREWRRVVVAYSGGVDSTYLAAIAHRSLGADALIVTARSPSMAEGEFEFASGLAGERGWNYRIVDTMEADDPRWLRNDPDRCYFCKRELFSVLRPVAEGEGISHILYGAIPDDALDVRPGQKAAVECRAEAPLVEAGLAKEEIRILSRSMDLPTWNKPQTACLASRIPTGTLITVGALRQVDRAESALAACGFRGHRVRHHGEVARIEIQPDDWPRIGDPEVRGRMVDSLRSAGYKHVTLDLAGYKPAGLNLR